jgi:thiol-disulfide isomerase/thioredoxin
MKSKELLGCFFLLFFLQQATAQTKNIVKKQFVIEGRLTGTHVDSVLLDYRNSIGNYAHKAKPVIGNRFTLSGDIAHPGSAHILFKNAKEVIPPNREEKRMREIYIEPGIMNLSGNPQDLRSLKISGSKAQSEFEELQGKTASVHKEMQPINDRLMEETDHEKAAAIRAELQPYDAVEKKITYQFLKESPNSYVTLNIMWLYVTQMSLDSVKLIFNSFNDELKATIEGKEIANKIKQVEKGMPGRVAPAFTKTDINGKTLSLADFKGKYVLLDFWASWCVPCRKGNPHMIKLYNEYKDQGFEIIGVADDDQNNAAWKGAVKKDSVGIWRHVLRGLKMPNGMLDRSNPNDVSLQYGISSLPTKVLIDPSGKIIGRYGDTFGGSDEQMDKMLISIFHK